MGWFNRSNEAAKAEIEDLKQMLAAKEEEILRANESVRLVEEALVKANDKNEAMVSLVANFDSFYQSMLIFITKVPPIENQELLSFLYCIFFNKMCSIIVSILFEYSSYYYTVFLF